MGVDVGGTFTDVILHGADGRVAIRKLLSTPPSYDRAVVEAVGGLAAGPVAEVVHGTTVATNAVLERRGSPTALVTTAGFRDVLELRRLRIPHMYDLFWRKPPPLVERYLRFELNERVAADGTVVRAARRGGEPRARRAPARDGRRVRGRLLPALLPLPRARAALRRDPGRGAAGGERLALERDPARAARVRALRDHRRQRVRAAADVRRTSTGSGPASTGSGSTGRSRSCSRPAA